MHIKIEAEDSENRTTAMSLKSSHCFMENFKKIKVTTTITPHQDGSYVKFTIEAEKKEGKKCADFITIATFIRAMMQEKLLEARLL